MRATKEYRLSCTEEAKKIVDRLTLEQKVWLMSGNIDITRMRQEDMAQMMEAMQDDSKHYNVTPYAAGGLEEEKVPPMLFVDGPRGVVCGNWQSTCFPVSMARGATFDPELEERVGHCIGRETRASEATCLPVSALTCPIIRAGDAARKPTARKPIRLGGWERRW